MEKIYEILKPIKALVLDMDGVLVDSEPIHVESFRIFMNELNLEYTDKFLHSFIGFSIENNVDKINKTFLLGNEVDLIEGVKHRDEIYLNLLKQNQFPAIDGVFNLINFCQQKQITMALSSSSNRQQIDVILERLSNQKLTLFGVFATIVGGDDVPNKKPAPDIYKLTIKKLDLPAGHCLAIEDSSAGVTSAKAAGLNCIALQNQYSDAEKLKKADYIVNSLEEVKQILQVIV